MRVGDLLDPHHHLHSLAMQQHVIQGDGQCGVMAMHHHAYRVAHEQDINVGLVHLVSPQSDGAMRGVD